jgi:Flp pilus assembly pilin Flp
MKKFWAFVKDEDGLELSEYAVMGALIILGAVTVIGLLQDEIVSVFTAITDELAAAQPTS